MAAQRSILGQVLQVGDLAATGWVLVLKEGYRIHLPASVARPRKKIKADDTVSVVFDLQGRAYVSVFRAGVSVTSFVCDRMNGVQRPDEEVVCVESDLVVKLVRPLGESGRQLVVVHKDDTRVGLSVHTVLTGAPMIGINPSVESDIQFGSSSDADQVMFSRPAD
jgi:hypothetical protein